MQSDIVERLQFGLDQWDMLEELQRIIHRHVQHIGDAFAFMKNLKRLSVVTLSLTYLAGHIDIRQEMHLDLDQAIALTSLAPSPFHVEAVPSRLIATNT